MRSLVLRLMLVLAAFAAVPDAFAADSSGGNFFLDARYGNTFGKSSTDTVGHQSSWGADGGYLWKLDDQRAFGFELGYSHFGKIADFAGNSGRDQYSANALSLGGHFQYLFGDDRAWIFQARGGLLSVKVDDQFTVNFPSFFSGTSSSNETGVYAGLGFGRRIINGFSIVLAYNHYSANDNSNQGASLSLNWIGVVAEYQF